MRGLGTNFVSRELMLILSSPAEQSVYRPNARITSLLQMLPFPAFRFSCAPDYPSRWTRAENVAQGETTFPSKMGNTPPISGPPPPPRGCSGASLATARRRSAWFEYRSHDSYFFHTNKHGTRGGCVTATRGRHHHGVARTHEAKVSPVQQNPSKKK